MSTSVGDDTSFRRFALALALLWGLDTPAAEPGPTPLRYLALGDSFTIGTGSPPDLSFPSQLQRLLQKRGLELFPQFVEQARLGQLAPDGLHPSPRAYAAWAESLAGSFLAK